MKITMSFPVLLAGLLVVGGAFDVAARADVRLPNVFSDHMVLQRDQENPVWGRADAGEKVTVRLGDQEHSTQADAEGNWRVTLKPLSVGEPRQMTVEGNNKVTVSDILVGEVWICSGQSNMAWTVNRSEDLDLEVAAANYPEIRMINFPRVGTQQPVWSHDDHTWMVCSPETVGNFSAVGYFFGRQLHQTLDVPVGLINNAWGGSAAEAWVPRETLAKDQEMYGPLLARYEQMESQYQELKDKEDLSQDEKKQLAGLRRAVTGNHNPGNIYNGVLKSHLGYGIRGAIWYQGESNAGRAYQYRDLFPLMIQQWRDDWGQGDFPFYWVQLADFRAEVEQPGESSWAELREAQTMTMDKLPNTGEAVIIDRGEGKDIHPRNKQIVGRRLARWALAQQYGVEMDYRSPRFASMEKQGNKLVLSFDHVGSGWRPFDVNHPVGFAVAGEDRKFHWADAKILKDGRIEVSSGEVQDPQAVRYGWADNPRVNLYNQDDLPLTPFRSDDWPGVTVDAR
ncbi:sialate O-acetylesterase [Roseimaritima sediminicola]|uniref:sialate O-acetylesterase n=1 Tax=Roseimaritima sediminicola TaxID=2662066 RepID=UPI0012983C05|nr:sialate O-acetylesterase [Roseimaritima sediminicola]